jgi:hypothetical protein
METLVEREMKLHESTGYLSKGMSYEEYRRLIDALIMVGKSTAERESESLLEYSKMNVVRMKRLDKTIEIIPELCEAIEKNQDPQTWLVLTEGWCGDAAQIVPVFEKIAALNNNIRLRFLLRDQNLNLMDRYLTNVTRSIPKLIVLNKDGEEIFNWGPRPKVLQEMFYHMKANAIENSIIKEEMHRWYAADKTITTQKEILELFEKAMVNKRVVINN